MKEKAELHREFMAKLMEARNEWLQAQNFFENVSEPDLVDLAIYKIEATRRRYMCLIKQARAAGIKNKPAIWYGANVRSN